jgi:type VI secretion system protein ImpK
VVPARGARPAEKRGVLETMIGGPSTSHGEAARARLVDLAAGWLSLVLAVRQAASVTDAAAIRARAMELKSKLEDDARRAGFTAPDVEAATFALVGFLDEAVLRSSGPARESWIAKPLQLEFYGAMVAGEEFFDRLERMRRERETRIEALEVYAACLAFGFAGKHAFAGPERLKSLLGEVEADVAAVRGTGRRALAPHADRPDDVGGVGAGQVIPAWLALSVGVGGVLLTWLLLKLIASLGAAADASTIRRLLPSG